MLFLLCQALFGHSCLHASDVQFGHFGRFGCLGHSILIDTPAEVLAGSPKDVGQELLMHAVELGMNELFVLL